MSRYKVKEYSTDEGRSFLKFTTDDLEEALERAEFYGEFHEVWESDDFFNEELIYVAGDVLK